MEESIWNTINENAPVPLDGVHLANSISHRYHGVPEAPRDNRRHERAIGLVLRLKMFKYRISDDCDGQVKAGMHTLGYAPG